MYNFINSELSGIMKNHDNLSDHIVNVMEMTTEIKHSLLNDIVQMRKLDGFEQQRHDEAKQLSDLVQSRLRYIQNPTDCNTSRAISCSVSRVNRRFHNAEKINFNIIYVYFDLI